MEKETILNINEFGPINNAEIYLNKINIITGVNATGKSTLSKVLYSLLTGVSTEGDFITNRSMESLFQEFILKWRRNFISSDENTFKLEYNKNYEELTALLKDWSYSWSDYNSFIQFYNEVENISNKLNLLEDKQCQTDLKRIKDTLENNKTPHSRYIKVLQFLINQEIVLSQTHTDNTKFSIINKCDNNILELKITFNNENLVQASISTPPDSSFNFNNISNIIYIDSPSVLDLSNFPDLPYHYRYLSRKLQENKVINVFDDDYNKQIINFEKEMKTVINGEFIYNTQKRKFEYLFNSETPIDISNTASGFKQLGIIQLLLTKRILTENSLLIIDEPEINLHQELQIKLAEILVKMSKNLNITLYINSHSPIFIEALELYTAKYDLINETSFYLAQKGEDDTYSFKNIQRRYLEELYSNIGHPYDILDEIRGENIIQGKF